MSESNTADKSAKLRTPQLATAAYIIKGALVKLYNTLITVGYKYETKTKARITVAYEGPKPDDADLKKLQDLVNKVIEENRPVEVTELDRSAAEALYQKEPVNGQYIYEKKAPPASVSVVTVAKIPDWTVCCSASKDFVSTTSQVGGVDILRFNHRETKQELEVCFQLAETTSSSSNNNNKKAASNASAAPSAAPQQPQKPKTLDVPATYDEIFNVFVQAVQKTQPDVKFTPEQLEAIKRSAQLQSNVLLTALKNNAYANGFAAKLQ